MPNVSEKKLKLLYLAKMLLEQTDEQHAITLPQMLEELEAQGIHAERKSLYDDLETLRRFGFPIETRKTRTFEYYLSERRFTMADVTLLADAVRKAPFLSQRKAGQLVKKLASLVSRYQGAELLKSGEEETSQPAVPEDGDHRHGELTTEELLHWAMERDVQVIFQYPVWKLSKNGAVKRSLGTLTASPWRISHQSGMARVLAYESEKKSMEWFSLGEIAQVQLLSQPREGESYLPGQEKVVLEFPQELLPKLAERFDGAMVVEQQGKNRYRAVVKTSVDSGFFAWLFAMGSDVRLTGPKKIGEQFRERAKSLAKAYKS